MSKTLNNERRVTTFRRELTKPTLATTPTDPPPRPAPPSSAPAPVASPAPATTAVLERELPAPAAEPPHVASTEPPPVPPPAAPAASPDSAVGRSAHRWYGLLTFAIAFGMTLGIIAIVRQSPRPLAAMVQRLLPSAATPRAPASAAALPLIATVVPPAPRVATPRDPFIGAVVPEPEDAALAEAQRVYRLMEAALRDAATALPAPQTDAPPSSVPADRLDRD